MEDPRSQEEVPNGDRGERGQSRNGLQPAPIADCKSLQGKKEATMVGEAQNDLRRLGCNCKQRGKSRA